MRYAYRIYADLADVDPDKYSAIIYARRDEPSIYRWDGQDWVSERGVVFDPDWWGPNVYLWAKDDTP